MCVCVCVYKNWGGGGKKWELGGLVEVEATAWSSFGSQHNERGLSDMHTSTPWKVEDCVTS